MSDRYNYLTVVLEHDVKDEDASDLICAIGMFRGVMKVQPNVADPVALLAEARAKQQLRQELREVLK